MSDISKLKNKVKEFRDKRDWDKYHDVMGLSVAMSIECSEVLELLRFKSKEEVLNFLEDENGKREFSYEIADVFIFMLAICNAANIDLKKATLEKLKINEDKYPISKFKGKNIKYNKI